MEEETREDWPKAGKRGERGGMDELKQPEKYLFKISALSQSEVKILSFKVRGEQMWKFCF